MPRILIVAYGNPLRSDDGVAWRAAQALQGKFEEENVEILCLHQLTPELAETVSRCAASIFIDAASEPSSTPGQIRVHEIQAGESSQTEAFSHTLSPSAVVGLAARLYGATPRAFTVTVTGENFTHGQALSPVVASVLPRVISQVESMARHLLSADSSRRNSSRA